MSFIGLCSPPRADGGVFINNNSLIHFATNCLSSSVVAYRDCNLRSTLILDEIPEIKTNTNCLSLDEAAAMR